MINSGAVREFFENFDPEKKRKILLFLDAVLIFLIAFIIRLFHLKFWEAGHYSPPIVDEWEFHLFAKGFAELHTLGTGIFPKAPLYPFFIGIIYDLFGANIEIIRSVQIFIGALNSVFVFILALEFLSGSWAVFAGVLAALWTPFIFFEVQLLRPVWLIFLSLVLALFWIKALKTKGVFRVFICGLLLGLFSLLKPTGLILAVLAVFCWRSFFPEGKRLKTFAAAFIGLSLVIAPVTVRNLLEGQDFVLVSSNGGLNFFSGNNKFSDGFSAIKPGLEWQRVKRKEGTWLPALPSKRSFNWYKEGLRYIKNEPVSWLKLMGKKFVSFCGPVELPNNRSFYFSKRFSPFLKLPFVGMSVLLGFALLGFVTTKKGDSSILSLSLFVLSGYLVNQIFFSCSRYRIPVVPFLIIFALLGIQKLFEVYRNKDFKDFRLFTFSTAAIVAIFTLAGNYFIKTPDFSRDHFYLGNIAFRQGALEAALHNFGQSAFIDQKDPDPLVMCGATFERLGKLGMAKKMYARAIKLASDYLEPSQNLASILLRENKPDRAIALLKHCLKLDSGNIFSHFNLGLAYEKKGNLLRAEECYTLAFQIGGKKPGLVNNLALIWARMGKNLDQAISLLEEVLNQNEENAGLHDSLATVYFASGDKVSAEKNIKRAVELSPDHPGIKANFERICGYIPK